MRKTILLTATAIFMAMSLVACGKDNKPTTKTDQQATTATETDPAANEPQVTPEEMEQSYIPENSYFIYSDSSMTEIIGITEDGSKSLMLVFPKEVTKISNVALASNSNVNTIVFTNDSVELSNVSFAGSNITTVQNLPSNMTTIPAGMFCGCSRLNTLGDVDGVITIPEFVTNIEPDAFASCTSIIKVDASHLEQISDKAFEGCVNLKDVVWNKKLKSIGNLAFFNCGFVDLVLPDSVETVGDNAFALNTKLKSKKISSKTQVSETAFEKCDILNGVVKPEDEKITVNEDGSTSEDTESTENVETPETNTTVEE